MVGHGPRHVTPAGASGRGRATPTAAAARGVVRSQDVGLYEVVPPARTADLHHVHGELTRRVVQSSDLVVRSGGTGHRTEPLAVDPGDVDDLVAPAHRAGVPGGHAVVGRGLEQVGPGVAGVLGRGAPGGHVREMRTAAQRVVDDLTGCSHAFQRSQRRAAPRCGRVTRSSPGDPRCIGAIWCGERVVDTRRPRGRAREVGPLLELAVLGLLHEAPMHGYELRKQLHARLGSLRAFSWGSVYPTLRRLQRAELIAERDPEPATVRGSWARRGRRVYEITAEGKDRLDELLGE